MWKISSTLCCLLLLMLIVFGPARAPTSCLWIICAFVDATNTFWDMHRNPTRDPQS